MGMAAYGMPAVRLAVILAALFLAKTKSNLFFYSLAEITAVAVFLSIFLLIWNSRRYLKNNFFVFIGIAYFFVGVFGAIHMLAGEGFDIFSGYGRNLPGQIGLAMRIILGSSFAVAPFFIRRVINPSIVFLVFCISSVIVLLSIFQWGIFPDIYSADGGETYFKMFGGYFVLAAFVAGLFFLRLNRKYFDKTVFCFLQLSLLLNIFSEIILVSYGEPFGFLKVLSYVLMLSSAYLGYLGIVETGLMDPYRLLLKEFQLKESSLRENDRRSKLLVDLSPYAIFIHEKGKIVFANPAAEDLCGVSNPCSGENNNLYDFIRSDYHTFLAKRFQSLVCGASVAPSSEIKFVKFNGKCIDAEETSVVIHDKGNELIYTILKDISKRKAAKEKIQHISTYDMLTGLYNRFYLEKQLQKFRGRRDFNGGVILIDINGLKKFNDAYGHSVGDELIQMTADHISNEFREEDTIARVGGDEFCILLPNTEAKVVSLIAQRIKEKISGVRLRNFPESPSIAVGTAYAKSGKDIDRALKIANQAMMINKKTDEKNHRAQKIGSGFAAQAPGYD